MDNSLIKRQDAIDAIVNTVSDVGLHDNSETARYGATFRQHEIITILKSLPSADRPQGEWIGEADGYADGELVYDTWYCSNCGYVVDDEEPPTWNYCPNCGCYNGGGQSEND